MLVNFKNVSKHCSVLNNNNNNGVNLPAGGKSSLKRHFYRFTKFTKQTPQNLLTYNSVISDIELSDYCRHAMHVFLHALDYTITTHLEEIKDSANYRFISKVNSESHIKCISEYHIIFTKS